MTRPTYIVDATRVSGGWLLTCREHPTARAEVPHLLHGAVVMRVTIAAIARVALNSFDIHVHTLRSQGDGHAYEVPRRRIWGP